MVNDQHHRFEFVHMEFLGNVFVFFLNGGCAFCFAMAIMKFPTWEHEPGKVVLAVIVAAWFGYVGMDSTSHDFECNKDYKGHCM